MDNVIKSLLLKFLPVLAFNIPVCHPVRRSSI